MDKTSKKEVEQLTHEEQKSIDAIANFNWNTLEGLDDLIATSYSPVDRMIEVNKKVVDDYLASDQLYADVYEAMLANLQNNPDVRGRITSLDIQDITVESINWDETYNRLKIDPVEDAELMRFLDPNRGLATGIEALLGTSEAMYSRKYQDRTPILSRPREANQNEGNPLIEPRNDVVFSSFAQTMLDAATADGPLLGLDTSRLDVLSALNQTWLLSQINGIFLIQLPNDSIAARAVQVMQEASSPINWTTSRLDVLSALDQPWPGQSWPEYEANISYLTAIAREYGEQLLVRKDVESDFTDLDVLASLSDFVASRTNSISSYNEVMSYVILGTYSGPGAPLRALVGDPCAGLGRDPGDCKEIEHWFEDTGFHPDFQDYHNQPFHFWASVATGTSESALPITLHLGTILNYFGLQVVHEGVEGVLGRPGASWEDFVLTSKGFELAELLRNEEISPEMVSQWLYENLGVNSQGGRSSIRSSIQSRQYWFPLTGPNKPDWYGQSGESNSQDE